MEVSYNRARVGTNVKYFEELAHASAPRPSSSPLISPSSPTTPKKIGDMCKKIHQEKGKKETKPHLRRSVSVDSFEPGEFRDLIDMLRQTQLSPRVTPRRATESPKKTIDHKQMLPSKTELLPPDALSKRNRSRSFENLNQKNTVSGQPKKELPEKYKIKAFKDGSLVTSLSPFPKSNTLRKGFEGLFCENIEKPTSSVNQISSKREFLELVEGFWISSQNKQSESPLLEDLQNEILYPAYEKFTSRLSQIKTNILSKKRRFTVKTKERIPTEILDRLDKSILYIEKPKQPADFFAKIEQLQELMLLCDQKQKEVSRKLVSFLNEYVPLFLDWNLSIHFDWQGLAKDTVNLINPEAVIRSHMPEGSNTSKALANIYINGERILEANQIYKPQDFFEIFLSEIYKLMPCDKDALPLKKQLEIFFIPAEELKHLQLIISQNDIKWEIIEKLMGVKINAKSREQFLASRGSYQYIMEDSWEEFQTKIKELNFPPLNKEAQSIINDPHAAPVSLSDFFEKEFHADKEQQKYMRAFELDWAQKYENYHSYLLNSLLYQLIPGFQILQLCTINCLGLNNAILAKKFKNLRKGDFYTMRLSKKADESYHITIKSKDEFTVNIPKVFDIFPKLHPLDRENNAITGQPKYEMMLHWEVEPSRNIVVGKLDVESFLIKRSAFETNIVEDKKNDVLYLVEVLQNISGKSRKSSSRSKKTPVNIGLID